MITFLDIVFSIIIFTAATLIGPVLIFVFVEEEKYEHGEKRSEDDPSDRKQDMQIDHL